ncbi:hypothetical protein CASFOL_039337 [Castilleja foliolosa]|uniref:F-box domain-containing protein n=1 Tax=Castilleja foliolosa TaxID=1961234 RepID=A0ABD3BHP9_9LAMI
MERTGKLPEGKKDNNPTAPWIELPLDMTENILRRLGQVEILQNAQNVCTTWRSVCSDPSLWRVIDLKGFGDDHELLFNPDIICRRAVYHSQGELTDLNIEFLGTDDLLHYISQRSSHLKRLRLGCCDCISSKGLTAAVKKFPELEELHLFFMPHITAKDIEAIGISCPKLKFFTFNTRSFRIRRVGRDDSYAIAIAKTMPNLRHLRLFGNKLTNTGMIALFGGCPNLESLDLRQCFNIIFRGSGGKVCSSVARVCSERLKYLRYPMDSTADYEWDDRIYGIDYLYNRSSQKHADFKNPLNDLPFPANLDWYVKDDYVFDLGLDAWLY